MNGVVLVEEGMGQRRDLLTSPGAITLADAGLAGVRGVLCERKKYFQFPL
jgi:hypothetical protein